MSDTRGASRSAASRSQWHVRRQAYVEFDLPSILDEQRFQDFAALYRLLHRTRLPRRPGDSECLVERYYAHSLEQGGRVREHLRDGVEGCIRLLVNGFLRHRANDEFQQRTSAAYTDNDRLTGDALYRQLLTLVYRFLFLLVSEERGLLGANPLYHQHYGVVRLRRLLDHRAAWNDDDDLWQSLRVLWQLLIKDQPQPALDNQPMAAALGLPVLNGDPSGVPLFEGRMITQFDHRAKGYRSGRGRVAVWKDLAFNDPSKSIQPQWFIPHERVLEKCNDRLQSFRISFCDVASPTNERTLVAALVPPAVLCGHSAPTILFERPAEPWHYPIWVALANSYAMDFVARTKVSLHMTFSILDSLPFPRLARADSRATALVTRSLRLSCTGPEMTPFWNRLAADGWVSATSGPDVIPGVLDESERLKLRAEIDVLVARDLFELTRDEMDYILGTFPTQQRYQEEKYGEFRSRRLILDAWPSLPRPT